MAGMTLCGQPLAIAYLTTQLQKDKELWELAVKKAEKWMIQQMFDDKVLQDIGSVARNIFGDRPSKMGLSRNSDV